MIISSAEISQVVIENDEALFFDQEGLAFSAPADPQALTRLAHLLLETAINIENGDAN